ncbi:aldehyde dehydrogenase family protein [Pseudoneobacillus rhizosphaerae]|uniref:Succinate-semialdehyde dehydrogenase (Acetylating) n=1 Tax=Pseudoneobacillus rhizosphaerae TaxID=2880968 RepID=A0A9C7LA46_9BACI|nr:aldehyde dehydrogenase family protein [Pseudoneobacillus rhizosphaerae]CAG9608746.1 Succinate-semialdehyde dehydrogenase (acetylating) [Pseudoneobacillus rhizosphaerae]
MQISEKDIQKLVEQVLANMTGESSANISNPASEIALGNGVFTTVEEAVNAAKMAESKMRSVSLESRRKMIQAMRDISIQHAEELAKMAVEETGLGRVEDKISKNLLAANKTPGVEDLVSTTYTGDDGMTLVEYAPFGIVGSITPSTNPAATLINNSISLVAAGNVVVYNPHPSAKKVSLQTLKLLNKAIVQAGGPENVLTAVASPNLETSNQVMNHPAIRVLVVTGGGIVVKAAMKTGKKVIAAGPGNPPVVVDETANLAKAGKDIVNGASFDNNVLCTAEKEVFVIDKVANTLKQEMIKNGAIELKGFELDKLLKVILVEKDGKFYPNRDFIGKDAEVLLAAIGKKVDSSVRLVIAETTFDHPLIWTEMLMPILPIVKVANVDTAIEMAVKAEKGNRHTAIMHSQNITNLTKMAREIQATIFVKNGPSYSGLGFGAEGFTTLTIAGPTGEGLTSARSFSRQRRCVLVDGFRIV